MARTGMVIDEKGTQGSFGNFSRIAAAGSNDLWIGRLALIHNELVEQHGQKLNNRFTAIRTANLKKQPAAVHPLPERQKESAMRDKRLAQLEQQKNAIAGEIFDLNISLGPFEYKGTIDEKFSLARLNDRYRGMTPDEQKEARKQHDFRRALMSEPHQMSGMPKSDYDEMRRLETERRFPNECARIKLGKEAIKEIELTFKTLQAAHAKEQEHCKVGAAPDATAEEKKAWA